MKNHFNVDNKITAEESKLPDDELQELLHKRHHRRLHRYLDELLADFIDCTGKLPSETRVSEFTRWSFEQTKNPTHF